MKTIIEMAREAGIYVPEHLQTIATCKTDLGRFAALVRADECEANAKAAEEHMRKCEGKSFGVGAAIRARGNT